MTNTNKDILTLTNNLTTLFLAETERLDKEYPEQGSNHYNQISHARAVWLEGLKAAHSGNYTEFAAAVFWFKYRA